MELKVVVRPGAVLNRRVGLDGGLRGGDWGELLSGAIGLRWSASVRRFGSEVGVPQRSDLRRHATTGE